MNPLKVLFVSSEVAPLAKTGGLGDVAGALPAALKRPDVDVRIIMPLYKTIRDHYDDQLRFLSWKMIKMGWRTLYCGLLSMELNGIVHYFIDNEFYFKHDQIYLDYSFDIERFSFFQRAVLESLGDPMDFMPDILHLNDWQTGMIPCLLEAHYRPYGRYTALRTVFTIHNLKYQGVHGRERIADLMDLPERYLTDHGVLKDGVPNFMKAGIVYADRIATVSPTYAREMMTEYYGEGLHDLMRQQAYKVVGLLNGLDIAEYNPASDPQIAARYDIKTWKQGKAACKAALQAELQLDRDPAIPLAVMVTRLADQKGLDLLLRILDELLDGSIQFAILGTGMPEYETILRDTASRHRGDMAACLTFDSALSHRLYAGADLFLMPSLFEPCGLSQMIAMRYGALPVVRETGGLKDTVRPYNQYTGTGNGFSFMNVNAHELLFTTRYACDVYRHMPEAWNNLVLDAMAGDYSWDRTARSYLELYRSLAGGQDLPAADDAAGKSAAADPAEDACDSCTAAG
ncbi:MAG: glycogen synthase GlgA [Clostridiaceae bacterium]|nr:glycogen synthase GlgA [Clostridiaceae bacterium]